MKIDFIVRKAAARQPLQSEALGHCVKMLGKKCVAGDGPARSGGIAVVYPDQAYTEAAVSHQVVKAIADVFLEYVLLVIRATAGPEPAVHFGTAMRGQRQ